MSRLLRKGGWLILLCAGLLACGQKGALVLPEPQADISKAAPVNATDKDKRTSTEKNQTP